MQSADVCQQTSLMASAMATAVARAGTAVVTAEINTDVDLSHLSRLLSADPGTVLLRPVCSVVDVGTKRVGKLGVTALALLAKYVRTLEVLS